LFLGFCGKRVGVCGNKAPPPPDLPADVIARTTEKYREAARRIAGIEVD
jgi:phosphoribosylaminoimidazole-succinocarboxamide synthase